MENLKNFLEAEEYIKTLSYEEFNKLVKKYHDNAGRDSGEEWNKLVVSDLDERLEKLGINNTCPKCGSESRVKNGTRNHVQLYKCKDCRTKYSRFTGTILEKSRWHWNLWIKVLEMTINEYSIHDMVNVLENDYGCVGIDYKTVWMWRLKLIHALATMEMPKLTGVIQVDETFVRESQKGSRDLVSYIGKSETRIPRYGRRPSKLGVMGPEFATITTAIDDRGYCVCKVSSLGKLTNELFFDLFDEHFNNPAFICSDANSVYENYCHLKKIAHYERPSNYLEVLEKNGYEIPDYSVPIKAAATEEKNLKILESLYNKGLIDRITTRGDMPFETFSKLKNRYSLSLGRVNELHSDIKKYINGIMTNVSTKYLQDYIGFFTYIRNWRVEHGRYPNSQKDAEEIFIHILKSKTNLKTSDVKESTLELPKPSLRYVTLLNEETKKARKASSSKYFKFNPEDGVISFNKREYLLDQPDTKLYAIAKECGFTKYKKLSRWSLVSMILKAPDIDAIIYRLLEADRGKKIDDEDIEALKSKKYKI